VLEADGELGELACCVGPGCVGGANVAAHGGLNLVGKAAEILFVAFGEEFDLAVGKIADEAGNWQAGCESADGETKADALNGTGVENLEAFLRHGFLSDGVGEIVVGVAVRFKAFVVGFALKVGREVVLCWRVRVAEKKFSSSRLRPKAKKS